MRRFLIFAVSLALPSLAHAQHHGGGAPATSHSFAASAPHTSMHSAPGMASRGSLATHAPTGSASGVRVVPGVRWVRSPSGSMILRPAPRASHPSRNGSTNRPLLSQDVPGLGFDFSHVAATRPGRGRDHDRDHFRNRGFVGAFVPFFGGGGYYMPLFPDEDADEYPPQEQAQAGEPDYYPEDYPPPPRPGDSGQNYAPPPAQAAAAAEPEAANQADEYVFVRRDGTLFFAVAYTWENGTLRYVTSEGLRRSAEGTSLDLDATQHFNEQRGLNFRAPAA